MREEMHHQPKYFDKEFDVRGRVEFLLGTLIIPARTGSKTVRTGFLGSVGPVDAVWKRAYCSILDLYGMISLSRNLAKSLQIFVPVGQQAHNAR